MNNKDIDNFATNPIRFTATMVTEMAPEYRFNTPTSFDVADPRYQETLSLEALQDRIRFRWPTSTLFFHNHIAAAVRFSGSRMNFFEMERMYQTGQIDPRYDSEDLRKCLKPQLVLQNQIDQVVGFQETLEEAEPYLGDIKKDCTTSSSHRFTELPNGVEEKRLTGDKNGMNWAYKFNPWELANRELTSLRADLETLDVEGDPIEVLGKIWSVVHAHDESSARELSESYLYIKTDKFSSSFEYDRDSEVGRLAAINKGIATGSDVSVRFDARYLNIQLDETRTHMIPFDALWNPETRNSRYGLQTRTSAKDAILELMDEKGLVVIDGIGLRRDESGKLVASESPAQWLVDTLGEGIEAPDATLEPSNWRLEELRDIEDYRSISVKDALKRPFHPTVRKIVSTYRGFLSQGMDYNPEEIVSHVLHAFRYEDWKKEFNPKEIVITERIG